MIKVLLVEKNFILSNHLKEEFYQKKQLNVVGTCKEGNEIIDFLTKKPCGCYINRSYPKQWLRNYCPS